MKENKSVVLSNVVVPIHLACFTSKSGKRNVWGFTRNCHPEFISGSTPLVIIQNKEEMLKQVQHDNRRGFTLIELLIAVLIIGILAAVAVPQYQKVQIRSKWAALKPFAQALAQAEESYYLANGKYTVNLNELDIACTNCSQKSYTTYSTIALGGSKGKTWGNGKECVLFDTYVMCRTFHPYFQYKIYLQHSSSPNVRECIVAEKDENTVRNQICKADTKSSAPYSTGTYTTWRYH